MDLRDISAELIKSFHFLCILLFCYCLGTVIFLSPGLSKSVIPVCSFLSNKPNSFGCTIRTPLVSAVMSCVRTFSLSHTRVASYFLSKRGRMWSLLFSTAASRPLLHSWQDPSKGKRANDAQFQTLQTFLILGTNTSSSQIRTFHCQVMQHQGRARGQEMEPR